MSRYKQSLNTRMWDYHFTKLSPVSRVNPVNRLNILYAQDAISQLISHKSNYRIINIIKWKNKARFGLDNDDDDSHRLCLAETGKTRAATYIDTLLREKMERGEKFFYGKKSYKKLPFLMKTVFI